MLLCGIRYSKLLKVSSKRKNISKNFNKKTLVYSSGISPIDKSRALPIMSITNEKRKILDELIKRNNELRIYLDSISPSKFKNLIQSI